VIQAVFFGICVLTDLSTLLTRDSGNQEQERQLRKLISLRDWTLAVLAFPVGVAHKTCISPNFMSSSLLRKPQPQRVGNSSHVISRGQHFMSFLLILLRTLCPNFCDIP
ncbi:hypothetical protein STEG23_029059, partial [Scotinomys teguina]